MSSGKVVLGVLAGVAIGATLGILLAPDKGSVTRRKISEKGEDFAEDLEAKFNDLLEDFKQKFEEVKEEFAQEADEQVENAKSKMTGPNQPELAPPLYKTALNMEDHTDLLESLFVRVEDYGKTNIELTKLQVAQASTGVLSSLIANAAVAVTSAMVLFVLTVGIALWLGKLLGEVYYGFFVVAAFYALAALICYLYLHKWVRKPIAELVNGQALNMPMLTEETMAASITQLEEQREIQKKILKEHMHRTFESLKPVNLVKNAMQSIITSPEIKRDAVTTAASVAAGYIAKKVVTGNSRDTLRNALGTFLEVGVTNMVATHPEKVGASLKFLRLLLNDNKKPINKERRDEV